jgi:RNA polymerase sigma factor (sigma-70 family)
MHAGASRPRSGSSVAVTEAELVARCRRDDAAAWDALVNRFARYVYAIAVRGFGLSEHDAEDVFQEVFARTHENLDGLRDDTAIRPFIAQLTRRLAIDRLRAVARIEPREDPARNHAVDADLFERLDEGLTIREALAGLPENCQEILDRFFARDQSYHTISDALDLPAGTIASRISRCLIKLRAELEGRNPASSASSKR